MNKILNLIALTSLCSALGATAQTTVSSPGTGVNWNMDSLATHFPANVQFANNEYHVSAKIIISPNDTFSDHADNYVKFDSAASFEFKKCIVDIAAPTLTVWVPADTARSFLRVRFDSTISVNVQNLKVTQGSGFSFIHSDASIEGLIMERTYHRGSSPSGALSQLSSDLTITGSEFHESQRSAIVLSVNSGSSLQLSHSLFRENGTANGNYPQINIGTPNANGVRVENCTITGKHDKVGGIAFLNVTAANYPALIQGNTFYQNRYGIAVNGRGITATILNNVIDSNNIEGLPMMGGSGINILGDSSLNIIAANNTISRNLWGVTVQKSGNNGSPKVSFGRLQPADPVDTGGNHFFENGFNDTLYAIYNNTSDSVWAQRNRWDHETLDSIESTIFHHFDDTALGWVLFDSFYVTPSEDTTNIAAILPKATFAELYPNPSENDQTAHIISSIPLKAIRIYDIQGRSVYDRALNNEKDIALPAGAMTPGNYFVRLSNAKVQQVLKWTVK